MFENILGIAKGVGDFVTSENFTRKGQKAAIIGGSVLGVVAAAFGIKNSQYDQQHLEENVTKRLEDKYFKEEDEEEKEES